MKDIFVDTSGWASLVVESQTFHAKAKEIYQSAISDQVPMLTTNYVLTELVALLTSPLRLSRPRVVEIVEGIKASPFFEIIHIDKELDEITWELLKNRLDKQWSFVDCSSFVVMQDREISKALTTDHHFDQADFIRLLK